MKRNLTASLQKGSFDEVLLSEISLIKQQFTPYITHEFLHNIRQFTTAYPGHYLTMLDREIPAKLENILFSFEEEQNILEVMDCRKTDKKVYYYYYCDVKDGNENILPIPFGSVLTARYDGSTNDVNLFLADSPFATLNNCSDASPLKFKKKEMSKTDFIMSTT